MTLLFPTPLATAAATAACCPSAEYGVLKSPPAAMILEVCHNKREILNVTNNHSAFWNKMITV